MSAYYNELDPFAAAWLRELIAAGLIAAGDVDERPIQDVSADDVRGYTQAHFFAGIGGWSYALRLAGWDDARAVWTGSCPCQPFSSAARGRKVATDFWGELRRIMGDARPGVFFGEQVAAAVAWFDGVCADLEAMDYTIGAAILPAALVGQDHARSRIYFTGHANTYGQSGRPINGEAPRVPRHRSDAGGVAPAHGVSRDVVALSGFGNAIVPQVAAEVIRAYMEVA